MQRYSAYKDSGAGWVGEVPDHWRVEKFRWVTKLSNQKNEDDIERPMLSLSAYDGIKYKEYEYETQKRSEEQNMVYMIVKPKQLVVNPMWVMKRSIAVSELNGIVSPAYRVYDISDDYLPRYFHYLMRSDIYVDEYNRHIRGLTTYDRSVRKDDFAELLVPIPPLEEQAGIVAFLEEQTAVINQFLSNKRRLIALLEEQKQVVINTAVTQGLDTAVPRKPSGIDWLGDIPVHWNIKKLKYAAFVNPSRKNEYKNDLNRRVVFLPMENISENGIISNATKRKVADVWQGFTYFEKDDVIVAKITPCFENGKGAYLKDLETAIGFGTTELIVLRAKKIILPEFLYLVTYSNSFRVQGKESMTGSAGQQRVPTSFVENYPIPLPPIIEQQKIVDWIHQKTAEINAAIERTQREIELIEEYRTTLIAHAVTGKIDVRQPM